MFISYATAIHQNKMFIETAIGTFARNLVDTWMDAYRLSLGMTTPQIKGMKLSNDWSRIQTAKSLPPDSLNDNADELATTPIPTMTDIEKSGRIPSAPSGRCYATVLLKFSYSNTGPNLTISMQYLIIHIVLSLPQFDSKKEEHGTQISMRSVQGKWKLSSP